MKLYGAIDLHSSNSYLAITDEENNTVYNERLPNDLAYIKDELKIFKEFLEGIVVESTYNWYWLVDGLMEEGYQLKLANTTATKQYEGLKYTNDKSDAIWLSKLLRLDILPEGYIYPKEGRSVRDLLRKRMQLVRQRTTNLLSAQSLIARHTGKQYKFDDVKKLSEEEAKKLLPVPEVALAFGSNLNIAMFLDVEINKIRKVVLNKVKLQPEFKNLVTVPGIGEILALTIMLETGDISRFAKVGNYASYCRCVDSKRLSNGKKKGKGNVKNGNKYLSWAYIEAANYAIRFNKEIKKFYQRKLSKKKRVVAIKAVAHKLCRACYYIMRDQVPFDITLSFGN